MVIGLAITAPKQLPNGMAYYDTDAHYDDPQVHYDEFSTINHLTQGTQMDLRKYFLNRFLDEKISFTELLKYAARHLARLVATNPGGFLDARIAATSAALAPVEACVTDVAVKDGLSKAKTQIKADFRAALPEKIRKIHAAVVAAYGDPSPELTECFPEGRSIFTTCRDEQLDNKLGALVTAITPKQAQVGATAVTSATNLKTTWTSLYAAQDSAMGARSASAEQRDADKATLQRELFRNVLFIAFTYPGEVDKCDLYCPQQYLENPDAPDEAPTPPPPPGP